MISEAWVAEYVSQTCWKNRILFLGTSLPIRHMDRFAQAGDSIPWVVANRGASGIDGITSTALGFAYGAREPMIALIGDMTFLHDLSGLAFLKQVLSPVLIIVFNNHGNGIFETLPIAKQDSIFQKYFKTPHQYDLKSASQIFGIEHQQAKTQMEFENFYQAWIQSGQSCILEVLI